MKITKYLSLLIIFLFLTLTTACGLQDVDDVPNEVVDAVEEMHDKVKENIKDTVTSTENVEQTAQATTDVSDKISESDAEDIALKHAGFTREQVDRLRTEYEVDDRVPEYEIKYFYENMEYEYTIHAKTGEILSFDWDN